MKREETMKSLLRLLTLSVVGYAAFALPSESRAQLLITGNDEKVSFDENTGKTITHPAGKDTVSIIDIADPAKPKIIVNLPLMNTITGPPVNLAITPERQRSPIGQAWHRRSSEAEDQAAERVRSGRGCQGRG